MGLESTISPECLKFFVLNISRIEQNLRKPRNCHPSKLIRYTVFQICDCISEKLASMHITARHTFHHHMTSVYIN